MPEEDTFAFDKPVREDRAAGRHAAEQVSLDHIGDIYNITQPEMSAWLQERKRGHLRTTGAAVVATANPGCHLHIENSFRAAGGATSVTHPVVLLARAYKRYPVVPT